MPETPDFEQIARKLLALEGQNEIGDTLDVFGLEIAEQLRLIWNARGAADIALIEQTLSTLMGTQAAGPYVKNLDRALRALDRDERAADQRARAAPYASGVTDDSLKWENNR